MASGCGFAKYICSICYEDLKPTVEDLQSISLCGHVFHELCLQQWFEYCSSAKKYSCPMCKQTCKAKDAGRLYFQSLGDANDSTLTQKPNDCFDKDPEALRMEVKKLGMKVSGLNSALERQEKDLRELNEELFLVRDQLKKEVGLRNEVLKEKSSMGQLLRIKSEELDKSTLECKRLNERSLALAKELAAFKLVSELDLDEEEILKLSSLGSGESNNDTIDVLRKSLVMRNRSYKDLMTKCNLLGRGEARACKKLEKMKEKMSKLKARVQELEKSNEARENEVLRVLKQNKVSCKCNMMSAEFKTAASPDDSGPTVSLINDPLSSRKRKKFQFTDNVHTDGLTLIDTPEEEFEHGRLNLNSEHQISEEEADEKSNHVPSKICNMNSAAGRTTDPTATVNNTVKPSAVPGDESMPLVIEDTAECEPVLNIRKESSSQFSLKKPGDICFSGGLLGPDGSSRYLGRWCKRGQTNESGANGSRTGELIAVGADGRGGTIKVLKSQTESSLNGMTSTGATRCNVGLKSSNLNIEHFFSKVRR